eukprot:1136602-Pelagomonas_calceolata.AAC.2
MSLVCSNLHTRTWHKAFWHRALHGHICMGIIKKAKENKKLHRQRNRSYIGNAKGDALAQKSRESA